jgi:GT2 family glycosyltransferase
VDVRAEQPEVAVVIVTYNLSGQLRTMLDLLTAQTVAPSRFEVVVADDGSTDDTREVTRSYRDRLRIRFHTQADQGFRAGAARNGGARLADAPILVFIDTGVMMGPDFVAAHLAAHAGPGGPRAVIGYMYGYDPFETCPGLAEALHTSSPAEVVRRFASVPAFRDVRHANFAEVGFDLRHLAAPWIYFWSVNVSVTAADFWAVGGFDEDFRDYGGDDVALGYRLFRRGVPVVASRQAWAIETPQPRNTAANLVSNSRNVDLFFGKYPEPVTELYWAVRRTRTRSTVEDEHRALVRWAASGRDRSAAAELSTFLRGGALTTGDGSAASTLIVGSGPDIPAGWPPAVVADVSADAVRRATACGRHTGIHGIGLRTRFADRSFDHVVVTSRLGGVWARWGGLIRAEATRVGGRVHVLADNDGTADRRAE